MMHTVWQSWSSDSKNSINSSGTPAAAIARNSADSTT
jgi:hypothetical protein